MKARCLILTLFTLSFFLAACGFGDGRQSGTAGGEDCAEITINPVSAPIGTEHIIDFNCFQANESVRFFIEFKETGERVYEARVKTDAKGYTFTSIITEPGDAAGLYRITAEGEGGQIAIAEFSIE